MAAATTTTSTPPSDLPSTTHRRIELQSPQDLFYLLNNARSAARAKIDLHLPLSAALSTSTINTSSSTSASNANANTNGTTSSSSTTATAGSIPRKQGDASTEPAENEGDEMRRAVERSVNQYIERTFEMVREGIEINGIEGEKVDWSGLGGPEEYEPYSAPLAHRLTALHSEIEALNLSLANTRREAIAKACAQYQEAFLKRSLEDDAALDVIEGFASKDAVMSDDGGVGQLEALGFEGREDDVRRVWDGALDTLARLNNTKEGDQDALVALMGRAQGAEKVVAYLEGR